ncbi:hypothetical protein, partial [Salmonella enterica]|uniref:hypothetical protein n=1 Tax=Salmonella enterica TaxID=28901 RepID=UPI0011307B8F
MAEETEMSALGYITAVEYAYGNEDYERVNQLKETVGNKTVTLAEVEDLISHNFQRLATYYLAIEQQSNSRFDTLVELLESR